MIARLPLIRLLTLAILSGAQAAGDRPDSQSHQQSEFRLRQLQDTVNSGRFQEARDILGQLPAPEFRTRAFEARQAVQMAFARTKADIDNKLGIVITRSAELSSASTLYSKQHGDAVTRAWDMRRERKLKGEISEAIARVPFEVAALRATYAMDATEEADEVAQQRAKIAQASSDLAESRRRTAIVAQAKPAQELEEWRQRAAAAAHISPTPEQPPLQTDFVDQSTPVTSDSAAASGVTEGNRPRYILTGVFIAALIVLVVGLLARLLSQKTGTVPVAQLEAAKFNRVVEEFLAAHPDLPRDQQASGLLSSAYIAEHYPELIPYMDRELSTPGYPKISELVASYNAGKPVSEIVGAQPNTRVRPQADDAVVGASKLDVVEKEINSLLQWFPRSGDKPQTHPVNSDNEFDDFNSEELLKRVTSIRETLPYLEEGKPDYERVNELHDKTHELYSWAELLGARERLIRQRATKVSDAGAAK